METNMLIMSDMPFIALIVLFVIAFLFYFFVIKGVFKIIILIFKVLSNDGRHDYDRY
ncbi:hypothetical protein Bind_3710 (plasmid) [Beijerinckia indica subsp. indica ATCC 9039]|uniref:Uncharacterized protein n=1 Tax=Beijerinckia indica subsp. indica (strain ATCC 9039 / DSM 1715 / NCIMB 8712) TaxID=395963 RepID=B2IL62_BEII9|nr:hypothetical protein Bind_3710 [Beijerinckia indica subsp. indica ATCC 9039]